MKQKLLLCTTILILSFGLTQANAAITYTWTGLKGDNLWTSPQNWDKNNSYPGAGSGDAVIFNTVIGSIKVILNTNITLSSITSNVAIINGASISTTGHTLSLTTGLTIGNNGSILSFLGSGTVTINGNLTVNGSGNLNFGSATDASTNVSLVSTIGTLGNNSGTVLNNYGKLTLTSFIVQIGNPASFNNKSTGTITATSSTFQQNGSNATINNAGIFNATSTTFQLSANPSTIINTGTFTSTTCTFSLTASSNSTIVNSGTFNSYGSTYSLNNNPCSITNNPSSNLLFSNCGVTLNGTNFIYNYGTLTANNGTTITMAGSTSDAYIYNYGLFNAGQSGSTSTISLLGTRSRIYNTNTTVSGTTYSGSFIVGPVSIIYPTSNSSQIINDPACAACTFRLQSDITGSAAIAAVGNTATGATTQGCVGIYNVERYFTGGSTKDPTTGRWIYRNYRLVSSPVNTLSSNTGTTNTYPVSLKYLANSAIITGAKGGYAPPNTFNSPTAVGNPSLYLFREDLTPNNASFTSGNFIGVTDISDQTNYTVGTSEATTPQISVGNGLLFFYRGDNIHNIGNTSPSKTIYPYVAVEPSTFIATGNLNQGSYQVQNWVVGGGSLKFESSPTYNGVAQNNTAVRGYNLIGNPYPCSINWDTYNDGSNGIVTSAVTSAIYVFNPVTSQYNTYVAGNHGVGTGPGTVNTTNANIIVSGEGFFVQANNHASTITFNENAKLATAQVSASNLLLGTPVANNNPLQYMRLTLIKDTINTNDVLFFFKSTADVNYNGLEDGRYLPGNGTQVSLASFSADSVQLAINTMPFPKLKASVVRLNVNVSASGQYTFKRGELESIPSIYEVWLMDAYKKDSLDLKANNTYIFNIDKSDTASYGAGRFTIVIRQNAALGIHLLNFAATKASGGAQTVWKTENEQNYTNFTLERSTDNGATYTVLGGFISGAQGSYSFLDKNPAIAVNLYRLKIEDLNGTITYSKVIPLSYSTLNGVIANNIIAYPNPASVVINLSINQNNIAGNNLSALQNLGQTPALTSGTANNSASYIIKVINITGYVIKTEISTQPTWQGSVSSIPPGTYIIQVTNKADNSLVGKTTFVKL